ncbi:MAG: hypothetical protein JJT75_00615, partial [Opitutales bacterium]|nr:hypothetical protein [Opitutales bacterium]
HPSSVRPSPSPETHPKGRAKVPLSFRATTDQSFPDRTRPVDERPPKTLTSTQPPELGETRDGYEPVSREFVFDGQRSRKTITIKMEREAREDSHSPDEE